MTTLRNTTEAINQGKLIAVLGTGVSLSLTNGSLPELSWRGLIDHGLDYCVAKGLITSTQQDSWRILAKSDDIDDLLGAAEYIGRKLGAPSGQLYGRWLETALGNAVPSNEEMAQSIRAISALNVPICTLNYDTLLEQATGLLPITMDETTDVIAWLRGEKKGILHLHGVWQKPSTCILGIRDYEATINDEVRGLVQRTLSSLRDLLFIGCGDTFADPNFQGLIAWLRSNLGAAAPQHVALVQEQEVASRHADTTWRGFVEPVGYPGGYSGLAPFILGQILPSDALPPLSPRRKRKGAARPASASLMFRDAQILSAYRSYLVRDSGQMTIEGMRVDSETAQRRFDLERLFVPLSAEELPPEIPNSDPDRERKLRQWREESRGPRPFGSVFADAQRMALLALPGGGKTMLLKRLAVAYADPSRRAKSADGLPGMPLMPVVIRCREWREHIRSPIPILLEKVGAITGERELDGLDRALIPLLEEGSVLLLVDGLDEIHRDSDRVSFVSNLEAFLRKYDKIKLVVTSREAGFGLVAPSLTRFCSRWRVSPLSDEAIRLLCSYWHQLLIGDTPLAQSESDSVSELLIENEALRRLAENPLLLTMLLVVKQGHGRLPPDRVSLYDRAVEVLLNTWNIKGHEALNPREAVPQLAYMAYRMMREGKQTVTEEELLRLLDEGREEIPQIRRYSKDTSEEFLKRVELRSSLLVEAGFQLEGIKTTPFYQFRHLTFQEYLAAVAAVNGYYPGSSPSDTPVVPLGDVLTAEEWKEVIPMAAVLAKKQAEPLLAALVAEGEPYRAEVLDHDFTSEEGWSKLTDTPAPVLRIIQSLSEEAEAAPETLKAALRLAVLFGSACHPVNLWKPLARGPYGSELLAQARELYTDNKLQWNPWPRNTYGRLLYLAEPAEFWSGSEGISRIIGLLDSAEKSENVQGLLLIGSALWGAGGSDKNLAVLGLEEQAERHLFSEDDGVLFAALWAWSRIRDIVYERGGPPSTKGSLLDRLLSLWLRARTGPFHDLCSYAFATAIGLPRDTWKPGLTREEFARIEQTRIAARSDPHTVMDEDFETVVPFIVAYHQPGLLTDEELIELAEEQHESPERWHKAIEQIRDDPH